jgi:uncharacterized protein YegL
MATQGKIAALNAALRDAIPQMRAVALENPHVTIYLNAVRFADDARWLVDRLTPVSDFQWPDVEAGGVTALGAALTMIGDALQPPLIRLRALPPLLVLVTDGLPTDDFEAGLRHLLAKPWGGKSIRYAIALGADAAQEEPQALLRRFISDPRQPVLQANDPEALAARVRWIATAALKAVCSPATHPDPLVPVEETAALATAQVESESW